MTIREFLGLSLGQQLWHVFKGSSGQDTSSRAVGPFYEVNISDEEAGLAGVPCSSVIFNNTTGTDVLIRRNSGLTTITLPDQSGIEIDVMADANELSVTAVDGAAHVLTYFCVGEAV